MVRGGLSLIETLVAFALIVAISSIALPVLSSRLQPAQIDAVARDVGSMVGLARAEASNRNAVRRVYVVDGPRARLVVGVLDEDGGVVGRHTRELPVGISVGRVDEPDAIEAGPPMPEADPMDADGNARSLEIAAVFPDGFVVASPDLGVLMDGVPVVELRFDAWTGRVTTRALASETGGEAEPADDAPDDRADDGGFEDLAVPDAEGAGARGGVEP